MENEAVLHDHGAEISEHLRDNVAKTESFRTVSDIFKLLAEGPSIFKPSRWSFASSPTQTACGSSGFCATASSALSIYRC